MTFETRAAQGDPTRLPVLAAELVTLSPDLLYCVAAPGAHACQKATSTIPVVFTQAGDPVQLGLVRSLARPGANITGVGSVCASGHLHIKGTVQNLADAPLRQVKVDARAFDGDGKLLGTATTTTKVEAPSL